MEEIINKLINYHIKGMDIYTHGGSVWLIFTKTKEWILELDNNKTLWYNFHYFDAIFSYASLGVIDNQQYITKWVEDNILNGVEDTQNNSHSNESWVEGVIKKGVKQCSHRRYLKTYNVDDTIQDGTENDYWVMDGHDTPVNGVIKKGVKQTLPELGKYIHDVEEVIEQGINHIQSHVIKNKYIVEEVIEDGILNTYEDLYHHKHRVEGVIKNGIKDTAPMDNWVNSERMVTEVIKTGIKETKTVDWVGDIMSTVEWMKENNATSYPKMIDDVIDNGEKINGTYAGGKRQSEKCKSVVEYGTKNPTD